MTPNPSVVFATEEQCILDPWYCAQTTVGREESLRRALARVGVETFLPLTRNHRKRSQYVHSKRGNEIRHYASRAALFPGYLFARLGDREWTSVKLQLGVRLRPLWVNFGSGPVQIPESWIEGIRAGVFEPDDRREYPEIRSGEHVKILEQDSVWYGLEGIFDREMSGGERVVVLMNALGALRHVEFQRRYVEAVA